MIPLIVTQRIDILGYGERRDNLDQRWTSFLKSSGFFPILIPNDRDCAFQIINQFLPKGLLLTGGNTLEAYGGEAPDRDALEAELVDWAIEQKLPVLGVCRGMQLLLHQTGTKLCNLQGHVTDQQKIILQGKPQIVNSYHDWGAFETSSDWNILGKSEDSVIKAIRHKRENILGIMWHPERINPFRDEDITLFKEFFNGKA